MTTSPTTGRTEWALDREIVLVRVLDAPRTRVFEAWTDPDLLPRWFGPDGYTCHTHEIDIRPGGHWHFDMVGPDGTVWPSRMSFLEIEAPSLLVMDHGDDSDDDAGTFRVTVTLDEQADGKTVLTLRQLHPTAEQRAATIGFGAVELGLQTLAKLEASLA